MPRPRRTVPMAQMSLFSQPQGSRRQNNRWISNATVTVEDLIKATEHTPEELYGLETEYQRPLDRNHCQAIAKYYQETHNWVIPPFVFTAQGENLKIEDGEFRNLDTGLQILDGQHRVQALHILKDNFFSLRGPSPEREIQPHDVLPTWYSNLSRTSETRTRPRCSWT